MKFVKKIMNTSTTQRPYTKHRIKEEPYMTVTGLYLVIQRRDRPTGNYGQRLWLGEPVLKVGHERAAKQDLGRVIDQQWEGDLAEVLATVEDDLKDWNTCSVTREGVDEK